MNITFSGISQPVDKYVSAISMSGGSQTEEAFVRLLIKQVETGFISAPNLTFIVEGATRKDAVFS